MICILIFIITIYRSIALMMYFVMLQYIELICLIDLLYFTVAYIAHNTIWLLTERNISGT